MFGPCHHPHTDAFPAMIPGTGIQPCCLQGFKAAGSPAGTMGVRIAGLNCYVSKPGKTAGAKGGSRALVLCPDIFGAQFINAQLVADRFAAAGYLAVLVDYFGGTPLPPAVLEAMMTLSRPDLVTPAGEQPSLFNTVFTWGWRKAQAVAQLLIHVPPFFMRQGKAPPKGRGQLAEVRALVAELRAGTQGFDPVTKVGAVGFCWGGGYALCLSGCLSDSLASSRTLPDADLEPVVDAFAVAHTEVKVPDFLTGLACPGLFIAADKDFAFPDAAVDQARQVLDGLQAQGRGPFKLNKYPGTFHGFVTRGDEHDQVIRAAKEDALKEMIAWFDAHM
ncbi:Alpha/Beta hydrolase protein [Haematococcus lacustris]